MKKEKTAAENQNSDSDLVLMEDLLKMKKFKNMPLKDIRRVIQQWGTHQTFTLLEKGRADYTDLFALARDLYNCFVLLDQRCPAVHTICMMLHALGAHPEIVRSFFESNISQEKDCNGCRRCFEPHTGQEPAVLIAHEINTTVH